MDTVDINKIKIVSENPRSGFDKEKLNELADSIRERGILQPLVCKQVGDEYQLIAGERRLRAAKIAGLKEVPIIIRDTLDNEIKIDQVIENLQREDLSVEDKFLAFKKMRENGLSIKEISKKTGVNSTVVSSILALENLDNSIRGRNDIDEYPKQLIAKSPKIIQSVLADRVASGELGVRCLLADVLPTFNKIERDTILNENEKKYVIERVAKETIFKKYPASTILAQEIGKKKMEIRGIKPKVISINTLEDFIKRSKNYLDALYEIQSTKLEYLDKGMVIKLYAALKEINENIILLLPMRGKDAKV
jgi:ParB family chromosome partitioning protein